MQGTSRGAISRIKFGYDFAYPRNENALAKANAGFGQRRMQTLRQQLGQIAGQPRRFGRKNAGLRLNMQYRKAAMIMRYKHFGPQAPRPLGGLNSQTLSLLDLIVGPVLGPPGMQGQKVAAHQALTLGKQPKPSNSSAERSLRMTNSLLLQNGT
jgi:hypothetical protein